MVAFVVLPLTLAAIAFVAARLFEFTHPITDAASIPSSHDD
jgi:hypothetical protein